MWNPFKKKPETKEEATWRTEEEKLVEELAHCRAGTDDYDKLQNELKLFYEFKGTKADMKRSITKESCGRIIETCVGGLITGFIAFGLAAWEKAGNMLTGSSGKVVGGFLGKLGNFFMPGRKT